MYSTNYSTADAQLANLLTDRFKESPWQGFAAALAILVTGASQSRQHVDTSSIHIESRKSPTKSLFDAGSSRISIFIVNTYVSLGCSSTITRIMRRTLVNIL
ncbi:hypothetical protein Tco_0321038 [Tanacetum coccineum]